MTVDHDLTAAISRSVTTPSTTVDDVTSWLARAERAGRFSVEQVPVDAIRGWELDPATGDLHHHTGRFFSIRGARADVVIDEQVSSWEQPVIVQTDIGVLGLMATIDDGVLRLLVQAKMEPGNERLVQVSPTVQATASNFERIHEGRATPFLEVFGRPQQPPAGRTFLVRHEQSEQGSRYLGKRNLNAIALVDRAEIDQTGIDESVFRWLTLADLEGLATGHDLLHMDTRSILGSLPMDDRMPTPAPIDDVLDWVAGIRRSVRVQSRLLPLNAVDGWSLESGAVRRRDRSPFEVVGVRVTASSREVAEWDQPLIHNAHGMGGTLLVRRTSSGCEVLVTAMTGLGVASTVELGPSLTTWAPGEADTPLADRRPVEDLGSSGITVFDNDLPEEGGRFLHSSVRHRIVEVATIHEPTGSRWVSLAQVRELGRTTDLLNMELRSLLACLPYDLRTADPRSAR